MGLTESAYPVHETFWAARRLLEGAARSGPVVAVFEDIHWAEPTFLELLAYLAETGENAALLLLCTSRPELLELRPAWREEHARARTISLRPLSEAESAEVVDHLLGEVTLAAEPRRRIIEAAQGNPLFVEQMVSMLIDDGLIRREGGGWVAATGMDNLAVPPSISALLAARLDRLAPTERAVLERGAVIGQVFYVEAVERLCPEALRPEVRSSLDSLTRRELVGPDELTIAGQEAFRFHHILIRDAAYQGLLKRTRAELHEKFAGWLEDRAGDHDEILGYHLEQAVRSLASWARSTPTPRRSGSAPPATWPPPGGVPALGATVRRGKPPPPGFGLAPNVPARPRWLLHAGEALGEMGAFMTADEVLTSAAEQARAGGDVATAATATVVAQMWRYLANPEDARAEEVAAAGRAAISLLEQLEAHEGLARAWKLMMYVHFLEGRFSPAEECVTHAVHHAELAGDRVFEVRLLPPSPRASSTASPR